MNKRILRTVLNFQYLITFFIAGQAMTSIQFDASDTDTSHVEAVEGFNASLPCAIRSPPVDKPVLTLWYIGTSDTPAYSYDQRHRNHSSWAASSSMALRAKFLSHEHPPILLLINVTRIDAKMYKCRMDYNVSNSRVSWVNLTVVVPPVRIEIEEVFSPVEIGQKRDIICKAYGGKPSPRVFWIRKGIIVDESYSSQGKISTNVLDVPSKRQDLTHKFLCSANNNDVTPPLLSQYKRNVTCGPLNVNISITAASLVEEKIARFLCTIVGSNPPPKVKWYLENKQIVKHIKTIPRQDRTISHLNLKLTREHNGNKLICRAENPLLLNETLEDSYSLNVSYKPSVTLSLGRSLNAARLKEGNDLFFDCRVEANPPPYKVLWLHEGVPLDHNITAGILVSETNIALQKIGRDRSGRYQCAASNVEGDATSNTVIIKIKYAPRCSIPPSLRGVALGEHTNISCKVDADPKKVIFKWTFNNSIRKVTSEPVSDKKFTQGYLRSVLSYTPHSERDYGTLYCFATNIIGTQEEPCSFTVLSAGPPEGVRNCSASNSTYHSVFLKCINGFDGGLPQSFLLQVYEENTGILVLNETEEKPSFEVGSLNPDESFVSSIVAFNSRGRSPAKSITFHTIRETTMHKILPSKVEPSPLIWVVGVTFGVFVMTAGVLAVIRLIRRTNHYASDGPSITAVVVKEHNPDLINLDTSDDQLSGDEQEGTRIVPYDGTNTFSRTSNGSTAVTRYESAHPSSAVSTEKDYYKNYCSDSSLYVVPSPDVNERTRLTSPRGDKRTRPKIARKSGAEALLRSNENRGASTKSDPRKRTIVRAYHMDCGPESSF